MVVKLCDHDSVDSVRRANGHVRHNVDKNMFLDVPWSRIERKLVTTKIPWETISRDRENESEEFSNWIAYEQEGKGGDTRGRLSEVKEKVHCAESHETTSKNDATKNLPSGHTKKQTD